MRSGEDKLTFQDFPPAHLLVSPAQLCSLLVGRPHICSLVQCRLDNAARPALQLSADAAPTNTESLRVSPLEI